MGYSNIVKSMFFRLFCLSFITYAAFIYLFPLSFNSDSEQYLRLAKALLGQEGGEYYYYRTSGYPLFMDLFGVTTFNSFYPLIIFQLICSALIPSLVYATINKIYPKISIYLALITWISFSPAFLSNIIMTDQIAMFLRIALLYFSSCCIFESPNKKIYLLLGLAGYVLYLLRPSDALIFFIIPISMLLFRIEGWKKLTTIILIFIAAVFLSNILRNHFALKYTKKHNINSTSVVGSMTGKMLFYNVYATAPKITRSATISANNGKYSRKLIDTITAWGEHNPVGVSNYTKQAGISRPEIYNDVKTAKQFTAALLKEEGLFAHSVMWLALDEEVGGLKSDSIFLKAAIESYLKNPKSFLLVYEGIIDFFLIGDVVYNDGKRESWLSRPGTDVYVPPDNNISSNLQRELKSSLKRSLDLKYLLMPLHEFLYFWITGIKILSALVAFAFLPLTFIQNKSLSCLVLILILMLLYHAAIAAIFAAPHFRYTLTQVPFIIMLAGLGMASFKNIYLQRTKT